MVTLQKIYFGLILYMTIFISHVTEDDFSSVNVNEFMEAPIVIHYERKHSNFQKNHYPNFLNHTL